mmetsp:Transcript_29428/g.94223  ORF Transcript_29428/g.94223 Transcript_29428/m.94223 type:complete len:81 (+) Transcript_29428:1223-1465(+)
MTREGAATALSEESKRRLEGGGYAEARLGLENFLPPREQDATCAPVPLAAMDPLANPDAIDLGSATLREQLPGSEQPASG